MEDRRRIAVVRQSDEDDEEDGGIVLGGDEVADDEEEEVVQAFNPRSQRGIPRPPPIRRVDFSVNHVNAPGMAPSLLQQTMKVQPKAGANKPRFAVININSIVARCIVAPFKKATEASAFRQFPAWRPNNNGLSHTRSPQLQVTPSIITAQGPTTTPPTGSPLVAPRNPWSRSPSRNPPNGYHQRPRAKSKPKPMLRPLRRFGNKAAAASSPVQAVFDAVWPSDDLQRLESLLDEDDSLPNSRLGPLQDTPLHWAARHGRGGAAQVLLAKGAVPLTPNRLGQLPLHLACASGHLTVSQVLLNANPDMDVADAHDAVRCGRVYSHVPAPLPPYAPTHGTNSILLAPSAYLDPLARLLGKRKLPPVNSISPGETPLHTACRAGSVPCIQLLLLKGADATRPGCGGDPPLLLAARSGRPAAIRALLDVGMSVTQMNPRGVTALHASAASLGPNVDGPACLQLLLEAGAPIDAPDDKGKTPVMYAAATGNLANLKFLVECGASLGTYSAVASAAGAALASVATIASATQMPTKAPNVLQAAAKSRSPDCLLFILRLMLAARHKYVAPSGESALTPSSQEQELLGLFPALQEEWTSGETTLQVALARAPSLVDPLLDACVLPQEGEPNKMLLDLAFFRAPPRRSEAALLLTLPQRARQKVLAHPLAQTLLTLKWRRVRPLFWLLASLHLLFLLVMGTHIVMAHGRPFGAQSLPMSEGMVLARDGAKYLGLGFALLLILLEVLKVVRAGKRYLRWDDNGREHMLNWAVMAMAAIEVSWDGDANWSRVLAAILSIAMCIQFLGLMSRLPRVGIYVVMMQHVQRSLLPFLLAYFWLFLGFAMAFHVLLYDKEDCANPALALLKTLIMFVGEYNYPQIFETDDPVTTTAANMLLAVFVPTLTILLLNLIIGLAVSDIQRLFQEAQYHRQVRLAQAVMYLEALLPPGTARLVTDSLLNFKSTITVQLDASDPEGEAWLQVDEPAGLKELALPLHVAEGLRRLIERRWGVVPTMVTTAHAPLPFQHHPSSPSPTPTSHARQQEHIEVTKSQQLENLVEICQELTQQLAQVKQEVNRILINQGQDIRNRRLSFS